MTTAISEALLRRVKGPNPCGHMRQAHPFREELGEDLLPCATPGCALGCEVDLMLVQDYTYERRAYCCESHPWPSDPTGPSPFRLTSRRAEPGWGHSVYLWVRVWDYPPTPAGG